MDPAELKSIAADIKFGMHPTMGVRVSEDPNDLWIQIRDWNLSAEDGGGAKVRVSKYAAKSEVVQACLKAAIAWFEHEVRESFEYKGFNIFNPHYDVDSLVQARTSKEISFDTRIPLDIRGQAEVGSFS